MPRKRECDLKREKRAHQREQMMSLTREARHKYIDAYTDAWRRYYILGETNVRFPRVEDYRTSPGEAD